MMLELHNVTISPLVKGLSLTVNDGQLQCLTGDKGSGKTTLLRAVLGFLPVDSGHISIDGELLTPLSAPYFRRFMAYVPQQLSMPDGYLPKGLERWDGLSADERYLLLLRQAVGMQKPLLIVDEPAVPLAMESAVTADNLLREASKNGTTVLAVNPRITQNLIRL